MVVDATEQAFDVSSALIAQWGDRKKGVGFDQLLLLTASEQASADFGYRIFNADGGEVGQCGNGACAMGAYIQAKKHTEQTSWRLHTLSRQLLVSAEGDGFYRVDMGVPSWQQLSQCVAVDVGNPHAVCFVPDLDQCDVAAEVARIQQLPEFEKEGVNVELVEVLNPEQIRMRVFERGVGETAACGSGATAAVIAAHAQGLVAETVSVQQPGGRSRVHCDARAQTAALITQPERIFEGTVSFSWPKSRG